MYIGICNTCINEETPVGSRLSGAIMKNLNWKNNYKCIKKYV